ncbi:uncharacterized protein LOC130994377 [Salvia miltiorrhiza]|uniref:uncharacterized protein LOC130994377 n=1 Tax=Salvia miltiorrhiza TaxID=226208 RepID=UPI0025AD8CE3|nr:uncharacterized protein LOC130994377 [Salvia miltiorrhiza]
MVFDVSGQVEVTFLGKEAQKLLGLDPSEFYEKQNQGPITQMDFLRQRLCNIVLLLKIKSRIFKDVCTFTADAIEILQDDGAIPSEKISIEPEVHLEQGLLKSATRQLVFHDSLDNDKVIRAKIAAKAKGKGKVSQESHIEHIKGENDYDMLLLLERIIIIILQQQIQLEAHLKIVFLLMMINQYQVTLGKSKEDLLAKGKKNDNDGLVKMRILLTTLNKYDVDTPENFDDAHLDMPLSGNS